MLIIKVAKNFAQDEVKRHMKGEALSKFLYHLYVVLPECAFALLFTFAFQYSADLENLLERFFGSSNPYMKVIVVLSRRGCNPIHSLLYKKFADVRQVLAANILARIANDVNLQVVRLYESNDSFGF